MAVVVHGVRHIECWTIIDQAPGAVGVHSFPLTAVHTSMTRRQTSRRITLTIGQLPLPLSIELKTARAPKKRGLVCFYFYWFNATQPVAAGLFLWSLYFASFPLFFSSSSSYPADFSGACICRIAPADVGANKKNVSSKLLRRRKKNKKPLNAGHGRRIPDPSST